MVSKKILIVAAICVTALLQHVPAAMSADYPARPITVIVPFGAGGEADIVARLLAPEMSRILGQNVAVQNVVGASGLNGMNAVMRAKPDGYTLGFTPSATLAIHPHLRKLPYTLDSFKLIGRAVNAPYYIVSPTRTPWKNTEELAKAVREDPSRFFWASAGVGSVPFLAEQAFFQEYDIPAKNHVSFNGDADAFQALAGDRAQLYATTAGTIKNFDVKPLVILAQERDAAFPDVPTSREEGKNLDISQWTCLFAPKDVPPDVVARLSDAMEKAVNSESFAQSLAKLGLKPGYLNNRDTIEFIKKESDRNADLLKKIAGKKL